MIDGSFGKPELGDNLVDVRTRAICDYAPLRALNKVEQVVVDPESHQHLPGKIERSGLRGFWVMMQGVGGTALEPRTRTWMGNSRHVLLLTLQIAAHIGST